MINQILDLLVPIASTLLELSIKSSALIVFIIILKSIFRFKLPPQWHYALWFILVIRLLIPFDITTHYNFMNFNNVIETGVDRNEYVIPNEKDELVFDENEILNPSLGSIAAIQNKMEQSNGLIITRIMISVWLIGMIVLLTFLFRTIWIISKSLKNKKSVKDELTLWVFKDCSKRMKIRSNLNLFESEQVKIPFLIGLIKPQIIIPVNFSHVLKRTELSHVFLHELSHYKRLDVLCAWVTTILNVIHWFNPLIWLAFYLMRVDREIACDGNALKYLSNKEQLEYGRSILQLVEKNRYEISMPLAVGLINNKFELSRRIKMLANKCSNRRKWKVLFVCVFIPLLTMSFTKYVPNLQNVEDKVAIVAGHGGNDPGAIGIGGIKEKNLTLQISDKIYDKLNETELDVFLLRKDDRFISLKKVTNMLDSVNADLAIYIHCNFHKDSSYNGLKTYYQKDNNRSFTMDSLFHQQFKSTLNINDNGSDTPPFWVLKETDVPGVMINAGFISNEEDLDKLMNDDFQDNLASDVRDAILKFFTSYNMKLSISDQLEQGINYKLKCPVDSGEVTSGFGMRTHPVLKVKRHHDGIDIKAPQDTPVYAAADGYIRLAGRNGGYGNMVSIEHADSIITRYGHLNEMLVKTGQEIKRGELIGTVGKTGLTTIAHLHFEVRINGKLVDPMKMLNTYYFYVK